MKRPPGADKLRGGYYTPNHIADFLAQWAVLANTKSVLEPSCGDGAIVNAVARRIAELSSDALLTGVELFPDEAAKARKSAKQASPDVKVHIECSDFFEFAEKAIRKGKRFDVVVGNPPFVRYQDFPESQRQQAFGLMRYFGFNPSRLANSWLPFLAVSMGLLEEDGRLAMVIPAELFQVGYASEIRQYLADHFPQISIVAFRKLVFPDIQQEIVLLLCERIAKRRSGVRVLELGNADDLCGMKVTALAKQPVKPVDHASEKWTKYFLTKSEILLLRALRGRTDIPQLGTYVDIDVGVVTGNNDFFLLTEEERKTHGLIHMSVPLVGRSAALAGSIFGAVDFDKWVKDGRKSYMFLPTPPYDKAVKKYIALGEKINVNKGYKCGIRREWFIVPSVWKPEVFFLRQADLYPRLVANETSSICTDTLHRGRLIDGVPARQVSTAFLNSLTFAASEVTGRSYGGGVMTFEPSEVERLPLPILNSEKLDAEEVDSLIRDKKIYEALDLTDRVLLKDGLGLSAKEISALRAIWVKLRDRRRGRKRRI